MLESTAQGEDLLYLQERHEISSTMIDGLTTSPISALFHIQQYKTKTLSICVLFATIGGLLIAIALLRHDQWVELLSGMIGSVTIAYAFSLFQKMKSAVSAVEKVAKYHELL